MIDLEITPWSAASGHIYVTKYMQLNIYVTKCNVLQTYISKLWNALLCF
jgi:hypothetical protein